MTGQPVPYLPIKKSHLPPLHHTVTSSRSHPSYQLCSMRHLDPLLPSPSLLVVISRGLVPPVRRAELRAAPGVAAAPYGDPTPDTVPLLSAD